MAVTTVKASSSTWVQQSAPAANKATATYLTVTEGTSIGARAYLYVAPSIPAGAVVSAASLTIYATALGAGSWGNATLTAVTSRVADSQKTWNNQPTLGTVGAASPTTLSPGATTDVQPLVFDLTATVQAWVNGTANFGVQLRNSGATGKAVYSARSAHPPILTVTYTLPPDTPHNLMPAGVVSMSKPIVQFGPYGDPDGDALQAVQVQVAPSPSSFGAPTFDSGMVTATSPALDLSSTAFTGFSGTAQYWRAAVKDSSGAMSAWSDPVSVTVTAKPSVTFSSPSSGSPHVTEVTPQIVWSASGQTSFQCQILDATTNAVLADSGRVNSATGQWGVPAGVINAAGSYIAQVDVYDVTRSPSPNDPIYTRATQAFTHVPGAGTAPTAVTVTNGLDWPGQVIVQCTETTAPDYFTVYMDGKPILSQVTPGSALVSGTTYQFIVDTCPSGPHTFQVDAVTTGVATAASTAVNFTNQVNSIWLGDPARRLWARISGLATADSWAMKDDVVVTSPIDGTIPQQIIRGMKGVSGTCTGTVSEKVGATLTVAQVEANLMAMKGMPQNTLRLVVGDMNIPVKASNISVTPNSGHTSQSARRNVSFDFFQCAELPFSVSL